MDAVSASSASTSWTAPWPLLKNVASGKLGRKDIIKIDRDHGPRLGRHRLRRPRHHRQHHPGRPAAWKSASLKLPERIRERHPLQESRAASPPWSRSCPRSSCSPTGKSGSIAASTARRRQKNKWYGKKAHGCAVGFLAFSPSPASPSIFFLRRSVFRPFYFITIMYTLFESKIPIERPYLLKSLFATGGG